MSKRVKYLSARELEEATKKLIDELNEPLPGPIDTSDSGKWLQHYFIFICNKMCLCKCIFVGFNSMFCCSWCVKGVLHAL